MIPEHVFGWIVLLFNYSFYLHSLGYTSQGVPFQNTFKVLLTNFHLAQQLVSHSKCTKTTKSLHTYLR